MNVELDTAEPITTEALRCGQRVAEIDLPAHDLMKTSRIIGDRGSASFRLSGIDLPPLGDGRKAV
jgi:uncharacterized protein